MPHMAMFTVPSVRVLVVAGALVDSGFPRLSRHFAIVLAPWAFSTGPIDGGMSRKALTLWRNGLSRTKGRDDTFVIQEHHPRRLHWDFQLERDGVLVSWALPKGLPMDPKKNHLAVQTEDHPLEYASFEGEIPRGEYGAGVVTIWDHGTYTCERWDDREIKIALHGHRARGRYVLIHFCDNNWLIHHMEPRRTER